jgi:Domain of unknown function (DUF4345)
MTLASFLRIASLAYAPTGVLHLLLGLRAENLLGAGLAADAVTNAALDSQIRFYGVSFALTSVLLWIIAADLKRFRPVLTWVLAALFAGGLARFATAAQSGWPPPGVLCLHAVELLLPPNVFAWHRSTQEETDG